MTEENICKVCSTLQLWQPALIEGASDRNTCDRNVSDRNMYRLTFNCCPFLCYSEPLVTLFAEVEVGIVPSILEI
jgi:hypothetical protein